MPTGMVRIALVAHYVLILLFGSVFAVVDEFDRWPLTVALILWCYFLFYAGGFLVGRERRPSALQITGHGLVTGQSVSAAYGVPGWLAALVLGGFVQQWPWESWVLWVVAAADSVAIVAFFAYGRPRLILTPEAVIVQGLVRTVRAGWDAVPWEAVPYDRLRADKDFVKFALGHYIANPGERAGMVGAVGLDRLMQAYAQHTDRIRGDLEGDGIVRT